MMTVLKITAIAVLVYVAIVATFASLLGFMQPAGGSTLVITTFDKDGTPHDRVVSRPYRLMQRRRVAVIAFRVISIRILTGVEQEANDVEMSVLSRQRHGAMSIKRARSRQQSSRVGQSAQAGCCRQAVDRRSTADERLGCRLVAEREGRHQRRCPLARTTPVGRRTKIHERFDKRHLDAAAMENRVGFHVTCTDCHARFRN